MDLKELKPKLFGSDDERAVSPVIGVILMVAITVILAAVIAAMVMGMGDDMGNSAPTLDADTSAASDYNNSSSGSDMIYISHSSGDSVSEDNIQINLRTTDGASMASMESEEPDENVLWSLNDDSFESGSTITIKTDDVVEPELDNGETVNVQLIDTESETTLVDSEVELAD